MKASKPLLSTLTAGDVVDLFETLPPETIVGMASTYETGLVELNITRSIKIENATY